MLKSSKKPSCRSAWDCHGALAREEAASLRGMADEIESSGKLPRLEDLERRLTVLEEKLFAVLMAATPDDELVSVRAEADRISLRTGGT